MKKERRERKGQKGNGIEKGRREREGKDGME